MKKCILLVVMLFGVVLTSIQSANALNEDPPWLPKVVLVYSEGGGWDRHSVQVCVWAHYLNGKIVMYSQTFGIPACAKPY